MLPDDHPDRIQIAFDDHRLVNNAGLILPTTLALHLGLPQLVDRHLDLGDAPGRANTGDKVLTLVALPPAFAGAGSGWWRLHRRRRRVARWRDGWRHRLCGQGAIHPPLSRGQALGTFLRSFRWGPRPPTVPGEPGVAGTGLGGWGGDRTTRHSPLIWTPPSARPMGWPRKAPATTATPASGATTRCWRLLPVPATC